MPTSFTHSDYTVGWICTLPVEGAAFEGMLDKVHPNLPCHMKDDNSYILGRIGQHNVVLAFFFLHSPGSVATVATDLLRSFPNVRFGLMVGVGGGAPSNPSDDPLQDIRLGDVVVSTQLTKCNELLMTGVSCLQALHLREGSDIQKHINSMRVIPNDAAGL